MEEYGKASNELFTQFVARITKEMPNATLAMFSKLKYVNATNFEKFRQAWNAEYQGGFIVHSKAFDGLKGNFPIGFLIWKIHQNSKNKTPIIEIATEILDKKTQPIGEKKFYNIPNSQFLNVWIKRPRTNKVDVVPLVNAITPTTGKTRVKTWADGAIAYMCSGTNDLQNAAKYTFLLSSPASRGNGFYVTRDNVWQAAIIFSVQRLIKPTWVNDRDQFLQPPGTLTEEFKNDCLIWMLFNGSNLTASANDLEWNSKKWSIVNHFIPFTEKEVNSPEHFESDFMVKYLADRKLSDEAGLVLEEGKKIWQAYFTQTDEHAIRDDLKLNRPDVGWYQVRKALQARNASGDFAPLSFKSFEEAYRSLTEKLQPQVYELGFLKN